MATASQSLYNLPLVVNNFQIMNSFEEGLYNTSLKRLNIRKDASYFLKYQEQLEKKEHNMTNTDRNLVRLPYFRLKSGGNLFDLSPEEYFKISEILELNFSDIDDRLIFDHLSYLPNLILLNIQYSKILFLDKIPHYDQKFFFNLQVLDLSFNKLTNQCFLLIKNIPELRFLNLTGNRITGDIPDISNLSKLEELNLSYNEITSMFMQNEDTFNEDSNFRDFKEFKHGQNDGNNSNTNDTTIKNIDTTNRNINNSSENISNLKEKPIKVNNGNNGNVEDQSLNERQVFEDWQKKYMTNLQPFFHKLGMLKNLKILDLANNKINVFDINPYLVKENNYFACLKKLDLSYNLITHNLGVLLVLNLESLGYINITGNNIPRKNGVFDSIVDQLKGNNIKLINTEILKENKIERNYNIMQTEYSVKKGSFYNPRFFDKKVKQKIDLISIKNSKNYLFINNNLINKLINF